MSKVLGERAVRGVAVEWDSAAVGFEIHVRFNPTVDRAASRAAGHRETHFFHEEIFLLGYQK